MRKAELERMTLEQLEAELAKLLTGSKQNNNKITGLTVEYESPLISTEEKPQTRKEILAEQRAIKELAKESIVLMYDNAISIIKQYQGEQGIVNVGYWREKLGNLISTRDDANGVAASFDDIIKRLEADKKYAQGRLEGFLLAKDDAGFEKEFKELTGADYNEYNMREFVSLMQDENADFEDEKYIEKFWDLYNKAFGEKKTDKKGNTYYECKVIKEISKKVNFQSKIDGAGDIAVMLIATGGLGSLIRGGFTKFAGKKLLQFGVTKGGKILGSMAESSVTYTMWDASKNYLNIKTKDNQYIGEAANAEMAAYRKGYWESAKFGAFAGLFNATVAGKVMTGVMKALEKPAAKVATGKVVKMLSKSTLNGADVMKNFMLNNGAITLAEIVSAVPEAGGFALYETVNEIAEELFVTDENGERHLPDDLTEDGFISYAWEKLKGQAVNLGEIKAIGKLLFMHKGGRVERQKVIDENLAKCETLKNIKIRETEINGQNKYEIIQPDGKVEYANSIEEVVKINRVLLSNFRSLSAV